MLQGITVLVSFMNLKLSRECKKDYMKVGEARLGLDYRIINKIKCFLENGYAYFKGVLT